MLGTVTPHRCEVCRRELDDVVAALVDLCTDCELAGRTFARRWTSSLLLAGESYAEAEEIVDHYCGLRAA